MFVPWAGGGGKFPVVVSDLEPLWGDTDWQAFSEMESGLRPLPVEQAWDGTFHSNISDSLDTGMPWAGVEP